MTASPMTVSFAKEPDMFFHATGVNRDPKPKKITAEGLSLTPKQIRARARRRMERQVGQKDLTTPQERAHLYRKPIEEWDFEELAQGRPKGADGRFRGPKPSWITQAVHEQSMEIFRATVKTNMNAHTVNALEVMKNLLGNDDVDDKGKPIVPAGVKVDISKFLIEHVVGKPTQRVEQDVSVKLQGILAAVMVNPDEAGSYTPGHYPGVTMPLASAADPDEVVYDG